MLNDAAKKLVRRYARADAKEYAETVISPVEAYIIALRRYDDMRELASASDALQDSVEQFYVSVFEGTMYEH